MLHIHSHSRMTSLSFKPIPSTQLYKYEKIGDQSRQVHLSLLLHYLIFLFMPLLILGHEDLIYFACPSSSTGQQEISLRTRSWQIPQPKSSSKELISFSNNKGINGQASHKWSSIVVGFCSNSLALFVRNKIKPIELLYGFDSIQEFSDHTSSL